MEKSLILTTTDPGFLSGLTYADFLMVPWEPIFFIAPTGALVVMMVYYISAPTFSDFHSVP